MADKKSTVHYLLIAAIVVVCLIVLYEILKSFNHPQGYSGGLLGGGGGGDELGVSPQPNLPQIPGLQLGASFGSGGGGGPKTSTQAAGQQLTIAQAIAQGYGAGNPSLYGVRNVQQGINFDGTQLTPQQAAQLAPESATSMAQFDEAPLMTLPNSSLPTFTPGEQAAANASSGSDNSFLTDILGAFDTPLADFGASDFLGLAPQSSDALASDSSIPTPLSYDGFDPSADGGLDASGNGEGFSPDSSYAGPDSYGSYDTGSYDSGEGASDFTQSFGGADDGNDVSVYGGGSDDGGDD